MEESTHTTEIKINKLYLRSGSTNQIEIVINYHEAPLILQMIQNIEEDISTRVFERSFVTPIPDSMNTRVGRFKITRSSVEITNRANEIIFMLFNTAGYRNFKKELAKFCKQKMDDVFSRRLPKCKRC